MKLETALNKVKNDLKLGRSSVRGDQRDVARTVSRTGCILLIQNIRPVRIYCAGVLTKKGVAPVSY